MNSYLRIIFPNPGFFLVDNEVRLTLDGMPVLSSSFTAGFDWWAPVAPGFHTVQTSIAGLRHKTFTFGVREGMTTIVTLAYSRMWGNFKETPVHIDFVAS